MRILFTAALLLAFAPQTGSAQNPVKWTLQGPRSLTVAPGSVTRFQINAQVENGWKVYSLTQTKGGPYGMTITLLPGSRLEFAGPIVSPVPVAKFDSSFKMITETYSGAGTFIIPLRAPTEEGTTSSTIKIRYQACSARFCLPPRNEIIQITTKVSSTR